MRRRLERASRFGTTCVAVAILVWLTVPVVALFADGPATQPAISPTTRPADPALSIRVSELIAQLGSREFKTRESAQRELAEIGEAATPLLIEHLDSKNGEIASRVATLIRPPADPQLRVDVAVRLIATTDPDWMERGVHMLFEEPEKMYDLFVARTQGAHGVHKIVFDPVADQLLQRKKSDDNFKGVYARLHAKNPAKADEILKLHRESNIYAAEAAYWLAHDALMEYADSMGRGVGQPTSRPATQPRNGTHRP